MNDSDNQSQRRPAEEQDDFFQSKSDDEILAASPPVSKPSSSSPDSDSKDSISPESPMPALLVPPAQQLTLRSIIVGGFVGCIVCLGNLYFSLKIGWGLGASITSAILGFAFFKAFPKLGANFGAQENVTLQTAGAAAGLFTAGYSNAIPALLFLGKTFTLPQLAVWSFCASFLGIFFAVPMRRHAILAQKLKFPSGVATAEVIRSMHSSTGESGAAMEKASLLMKSMLYSGLWILVTFFFPFLYNIPIFMWLQLPSVDKWRWNINVSPAFLGAGVLMGTGVTGAMMLSSVFCWGIFGPILVHLKWVDSLFSFKIVDGHIQTSASVFMLWIGLAMMLSNQIVSLSMMWRTVLRAFLPASMSPAAPSSSSSSSSSIELNVMSTPAQDNDQLPLVEKQDEDEVDEEIIDASSSSSSSSPSSLIHRKNASHHHDDDSEENSGEASAPAASQQQPKKGNPATLEFEDEYEADGTIKDPASKEETVPFSWWFGGLVASSMISILVVTIWFGMHWYEVCIAIVLGLFLSIVAVQATGESDITPITSLGLIAQGVFSFIHPGSPTTLIMAANITGASAMQATDLMQDLKTGHLLRASPKAQFISQVWGGLLGAIFSVFGWALFSSAYEIGGEKFPAPNARNWLVSSQVLANGFGGLPQHLLPFCIVAAVIGAAEPLLQKYYPNIAKFFPSIMGLSLGFIIPEPATTTIMFVGAFAYAYWLKKDFNSADRYGVAVASGMCAGEGLAGIVQALFNIIGLDKFASDLFCYGSNC